MYFYPFLFYILLFRFPSFSQTLSYMNSFMQIMNDYWLNLNNVVFLCVRIFSLGIALKASYINFGISHSILTAADFLFSYCIFCLQIGPK